MNKEWSEMNKAAQLLLRKKDSFSGGIDTVLGLRRILMQVVMAFREELSGEDFDAMPFMNADGYYSKTIAYSLWHIFRIEDIVAHTLINGDEQVFFSGNYKERTCSPIITTGNELVKEQIADFSRQLDIGGLYGYISEVRESTDALLRGLSFEMIKQRIPEERRESLLRLDVVSRDESAAWLIDYWCGKDIRGLIQMPFSRHWIMHIEAALRIKNRLNR